MEERRRIEVRGEREKWEKRGARGKDGCRLKEKKK